MLLSEQEHSNLRQQYNPDGSILRRHQMRMLQVMVEIDRICKKHNIDYILSSGTLIGAVRHGGFVPWDDDLDIEIERKQYKRFLKIVQFELPEWLEVQSHKSDRFYVAPYIKIRDKYSKITEDHNCDINYNMRGAYVDIFPIERLSGRLSALSTSLHVHLLYNPSHQKLERSWRLSAIYFVLTSLVYPCFRFFSTLTRCKHRNTAGSCFSKPRDLKDFYPVTAITFEDCKFNAPRDCDSYLRKLFGGYTKLPDKISAHTVEVEIFNR